MEPQRDRRKERFEALFALARDPLTGFLLRRAPPDAVEDLFAETMTVAWRRMDDIPVGAELPWLYGVGRRVLANHRRSSSRFGRLLERITLAEPPPELALTIGIARDPALAAAMRRLRTADVEILRLWAWEDLAPAEIAAALRISPNAASIRLHRAKQRLRDALDAGSTGAAGERPDPPKRKVADFPGHQPGVEQEAR